MHSDTIFVPSGDTVNLSFNYLNSLGNFGMVFKPKSDSIIIKTIEVPIENKSNQIGYFVGSFGIGAILGIIAGMSK